MGGVEVTMKTKVRMERVNTEIHEKVSIELCAGEIPGARAMHHILTVSSELRLPANAGYYHIVMLIPGEADFATDGKGYAFNERVTFVPALDKELKITAKGKVNILEIQWDCAEEDRTLIAEYQAEFPYIQLYRECIQYTESTKSEKTISRMTIPQRVIPRLASGSVETYGIDMIQPHSHPMLDQFFFSLPENDMEVLINGEHIPMKGNELLHIPLGSEHGVYVSEGKHCHYMWVDFILDNEEGLKNLDEGQSTTNTIRSFDVKEREERK